MSTDEPHYCENCKTLVGKYYYDYCHLCFEEVCEQCGIQCYECKNLFCEPCAFESNEFPFLKEMSKTRYHITVPGYGIRIVSDITKYDVKDYKVEKIIFHYYICNYCNPNYC